MSGRTPAYDSATSPVAPRPLSRPVTRTLYEGPGGGRVRRTVLPGGLRVLSESMPAVQSATFGVWVGVGSRDETHGLAGASHYLEHLVFKGTRERTALGIAAAVDAVGGELNAFTAKEHTCYYAHVLAEDLPLAVDIVCDLVTDALLHADDVESERGVVLEEIAMRDDDPSDAVHDLFGQTLFGDHPLGRPVIGTTESIEALTRAQIAGYYRRRYLPQRMVVAAAGQVDHKRLVDLVRRSFGDRLDRDVAPESPRIPARRGTPAGPRPGAQPVVTVLHRDTEQAHLIVGGSGIDRHDERRFAAGVLNAALGGGMSSRLFQEVRERRGLAYSVFSYTSQYADAGLFGVYAGCQPSRVRDVLSIVREELHTVASKGLTDEEISRGKGQLKGSMMLGLEDTGSRMSRIGKSELSYGDHVDITWLRERIDAVTPDEIRELAADLLRDPTGLAVVGPFDEGEFADSLG